MGGSSAPVDLATGARTQSWLAVSEEPAAKVSGKYWYQLRQQDPAREALDPEYQDELLAELERLCGLPLP
jgi:hypothetical protein